MTSSTIAEASTPPRLKTRYADEIKPALLEQFSFDNVMQIPRVVKVVVEHGCRRGGPGREADRGRCPRSGDDHRAEAGDPQGDEVHRAVQAARGHADRRQGDAARRPDVGVPGSAADHRAAPYP